MSTKLVFKLKCHEHPTFRGVRKPTSGCSWCRWIWRLQRVKKFFGLEYAKPRKNPYPGILFGPCGHPFHAGNPVEAKIIEAAQTPDGLFIASTEGELLKRKIGPAFDHYDG